MDRPHALTFQQINGAVEGNNSRSFGLRRTGSESWIADRSISIMRRSSSNSQVPGASSIITGDNSGLLLRTNWLGHTRRQRRSSIESSGDYADLSTNIAVLTREVQLLRPTPHIAELTPPEVVNSHALSSGQRRSSIPTSFEVGLSKYWASATTAAAAPVEPPWKKIAQVKILGIREDFYATLLSSYSSWYRNPLDALEESHWTNETRKLSSEMALDSISAVTNYAVHTWSRQLGFQKLKNLNTLGVALPLYEPPLCIAQSNLGFLLVGYQGGMVVFRDILNPNTFCITYLKEAVDLFYDYEASKGRRGYAHSWQNEKESQEAVSVTHAIWAHNTVPNIGSTVSSEFRVNMLRCGLNAEGFVGDQLGRVFKFVITLENGRPRFRIVAGVSDKSFHTDSICSMTFDLNETRLCVAGSDSMIRIWVYDRDAPSPDKVLTLESDIRHFSAVRAISFCPSIPTLLITGGGRHDRTLRVFSVNMELALCEIKMPAQIVGLVFVSKLEVFVALGHSRLRKYQGLGKVVNILTGKTVADIPGEGYTLTAMKTQNGFCLNTSMNNLITYTWNADAVLRKLSTAEIRAEYSMSLPSTTLR